MGVFASDHLHQVYGIFRQMLTTFQITDIYEIGMDRGNWFMLSFGITVLMVVDIIHEKGESIFFLVNQQTFSGGIQEDEPSFGVPVLVMRDTTERPEAVEAGTLKLVGTSESGIYSEFSRLLADKNEYKRMPRTSNPYDDDKADIIEFGYMRK